MIIAAVLLCLAAPLDIVADGEARIRLVADGSPRAVVAAELLGRHVVLMAGAALPATGTGPALTLRSGAAPGYTIRIDGESAVIEGADPVRAVFDLLEAWGCRFDADPPQIPRTRTLRLTPRSWTPRRRLVVEGARFDASIPAAGLAVVGLSTPVPPEVKAAGYRVQVASDSFDDFLPPALFAKHPDWFALRGGVREARGNFALTNAAARAAYLDAVGAWLSTRPDVDCLGIWPEVTSVWCEESEALGHAEAYALLWRDAARRFPQRRFEILATGLTLRPPKIGTIPANIEVRLRPGRDASGLQGLASQPIAPIVKAWEARGARIVLEIDAAPASWCGLPWPCHDAIRANARRFEAAVLRSGGHEHARLWRDPTRELPVTPLAKKARKVRSWGHPRDAAELFDELGGGLGYRIGSIERLYRIAVRDNDAAAAQDVYLGYRAILDSMADEHAKVYRRYRRRDYQRMLEDLLPGGAEIQIGPAKVRDTFEEVSIELDRLRLRIDRTTGSVVALRRLVAGRWSDALPRAFAVVALASKTKRTAGEVSVTSPGTGLLRIDLGGRIAPGGPRWRTRLDLRNASGLVHQTAEVKTPGGIAVGCRWPDGFFDHWVCPAHATEGLVRGQPAFGMPPMTWLFCRKGARGLGLAVRGTHAVTISVSGGEQASLVATSPGGTIEVDWLLFSDNGELGR